MKLIAKIILLLILSGCSMHKYCSNRFPPAIKDSIRITEKLVHRDTTVYITLPGEVVYDTVYIDTTSNTAHSYLQTQLASSTAFWNGSKLIHQLTQKDSVLSVLLANAITDRESYIFNDRSKVETVIRYETTAWQNFQMSAAWLLAAILLFSLAWKRFLQGIFSRLLTLIKKRKPP